MSSWSQLIAIFRRFEHHSGNAWQSGGVSFSYSDLFHRACAIALFISSHQRENQSELTPVLLYGHKDFDFLASWWASLLSGCAVIPVESDNTQKRLNSIALTTRARLLINTQGTALTSDHAHVVASDSIPNTLHGPEVLDEIIQSTKQTIAKSGWHSLAYIMFSSGTTGEPKGIQITLDNLADFVQWICREFPLTGAVTGNVRYCFDVSLFELWLAWAFLQPLSVLDHAELINTRKLIAQHADMRLSCWVSTPSIVRLYLMDKTFNHQTLPCLKRFMFCGETLTKEIVASLWSKFPGAEIINTYGPTECTVAVTSARITDAMMAEDKPLPIGSTRSGTIVHLERKEASADTGLIVISGLSVGAGYLNASPDRNANFSVTPQGRAYNTGDIGTFDGEHFYFLGRNDREVKIQGYRIDLYAIEDYLLAYHGVSDVVVEPWCRKGRPEAIQVFIVSHLLKDLSQIANHMLEHFPAWSIPRYWYRIADIQLNHNGKLDRQAVKQNALENGCKYVFISNKSPV